MTRSAKGATQLVPHLIGQDGDAKDGEALRQAQPEEFGKLVEGRGPAALPGCRELIETCGKRGLRTVLATSSEEKQLKTDREASGVDWREMVDETAMAERRRAEQAAAGPRRRRR